jgi:putative peptide zinc metalloprotease protein
MSLPELRQELSLHPGPAAPDGSPTWHLQDPVGNRFFQLSWPAFEILSRWSLNDVQAVVDAVNRNTTLCITSEDVKALILFLQQHHLLRAGKAEDSARLHQAQQAARPGKARWLLKNYLFFRLPLVRPEPLLKWLAPLFALAFTPTFWWLQLALLCTGLYLVSRQWDAFIHTFSGYSGWQAFIGIGIALSFAKILHELAHALTAHRYGCRVPTMGVAFLVMFPVLYTDTNDAWKLPSRRARLHIAAAGVLAELVLAVWATVVWSFLPEGHFKTGVFLLATSTWLITVAINASPFMRFDGYFLLADYLNLPNLHERAFALGRWWLRKTLFGWGDPVPEHFPPRRHRFLILFAIGTWIYRAVLFLSIALLVYHLFFKALGILLMLVELAWFLGVPVQRELKVWWQRRQDMHWNRHTRRSAALCTLVMVVLLFPWQSGLRAPAVIMAQQAQGLYTPYAAQVASDAARQGEQVKAGQVLVRLHSPELDYQLRMAQAQEQQLRWQLQQQSFDTQLQQAGPALRQRWESARQQVASLQRQIDQLTITAPFDGDILARNDALTPGTWLSAGEQLFQLAAPAGIKGEAYISEPQLLRLQNSVPHASQLTFVAEQPGMPALHCHSQGADPVNIPVLEQPALASVHGGTIATQLNTQQQLVPVESHFRLRFDTCTGHAGTRQILAGTALLQGERKSLLARAIRHARAILVSEAGF